MSKRFLEQAWWKGSWVELRQRAKSWLPKGKPNCFQRPVGASLWWETLSPSAGSSLWPAGTLQLRKRPLWGNSSRDSLKRKKQLQLWKIQAWVERSIRTIDIKTRTHEMQPPIIPKASLILVSTWSINWLSGFGELWGATSILQSCHRHLT